MGDDDGFWARETPAPDDAAVRVPVGGLEEGRSRIFGFVRGGERLTGIVVRWEGTLHAYVNRCPHIRLALDLGDGRVWAPGERALLCTMHGAQFDPGTGHCFVGPPRGRHLERLPYEIDGGDVVVQITPDPWG